MRATLLPLVLVVVCASVQGQLHQPTTNLLGQRCTPSIVARCGTIIHERTFPSKRFGPNVCVKVTSMRDQVYSYRYRLNCRYSFRGRRCSLSCYRTNHCHAVRTRNKIRFDCCEGFTTVRYATQRMICRDGCPIKLEDTVLDCLDRLNRTMLLDDDSLDSIESRLDDSSVETTLFIPTETALMNTEVDNETIASHLTTGSFRAEKLYIQGLMTPLMTGVNGHFIHITTIYNKRYQLFANGVEVTGANACFAKNGVVHEINGVIMPSSRRIMQVLDDTPELSSFRELLNKFATNKTTGFGTKYLVTVFAPSNSAIDNNTMTCLSRSQNRHLLKRFLWLHIMLGTDYNSTIRLKNEFFPVLCGIPHFHLPFYTRISCSVSVKVNGSDTIVGGSRIVDADIPASNGVIHILSRPMNHPNLNLSALCPPPSTSAPSSTTASSSSPTTVSESPSATRPPDETISRPTTPPTRPPDEA